MGRGSMAQDQSKDVASSNVCSVIFVGVDLLYDKDIMSKYRRKCAYDKCTSKLPTFIDQDGYVNHRLFCNFHRHKCTIRAFLGHLYRNMRARVEGRARDNSGGWAGKPIMPKDVFISWSINNPEFLRLYKRWATCAFDQKLTPSVNRINSSKGYTLDNVEWLTNSQNSGLSSVTKRLKEKRAVYDVLGVTK